MERTASLAGRAGAQSRRDREGLLRRFVRQWDLQLMVIPAIGMVVLFSYVPMWGLIIAFQDYTLGKGVAGSPWVGTKHFEMFFNAPEFWQLMRNTLCISLLKLLFGFPAPIVLAVMLNEIRQQRFKRVVQTITYLPHFISWVVIAGFVFNFLNPVNGNFNYLLQSLQLIDEPIAWLNIPEYFWTILITTGIWKEIGFSAIIYLAAIAGIDPSLYESAEIDGASKLQKTFFITIPSIMTTIIILLIMNIGSLLNAGFDDILLLTNNGTNYVLRGVADVIDTYVYRIGLQNFRYSYATAAGLFKAVTSVTLLVLANYLARKAGRTSLW